MAGSPSIGAADLLHNAGVGVKAANSGWSIRIGKMTDAPDQQIVLYDSPGQAPNPKWLLDYPYLQVLVRGAVNDYPGAANKIISVNDVLLGIFSQDINGDRWDSVTGVGSWHFLSYDANNRPLFTVNYKIILEPAASALTHREPL